MQSHTHSLHSKNSKWHYVQSWAADIKRLMTWGIIYAYLSQQAETEAICLKIHGHGDGPDEVKKRENRNY